jgi:hypothetical protein
VKNLSFVSGLKIVTNLLSKTNELSKQLQSETIDLSSALLLVDCTENKLKNLCNETEWNSLWTEIIDICETNEIEMTSSFKRKKSIPNSLKEYFLNSGVNYENNYNSREDIKINVFYYFIDCFITNLKDRFKRQQ